MPSEVLQKIFKHRQRLPWQTVENHTVIVEPDKNFTHELDEVASFVWERINGQRTIAEISQEVCGEFTVDETTAINDVANFAVELESKGLLVCQN